jgi:hypothetical protein
VGWLANVPGPPGPLASNDAIEMIVLELAARRARLVGVLAKEFHIDDGHPSPRRPKGDDLVVERTQKPTDKKSLIGWSGHAYSVPRVFMKAQLWAAS